MSSKDWLNLLDNVTASFAYIRWLGDHKAIEKIATSWDRLVVDRSSVIDEWAEVVRQIRARDIEVFGYFNNHFAGHGPGSVEMFRERFAS